jgi:hypothetical protein
MAFYILENQQPCKKESEINFLQTYFGESLRYSICQKQKININNEIKHNPTVENIHHFSMDNLLLFFVF